MASSGASMLVAPAQAEAEIPAPGSGLKMRRGVLLFIAAFFCAVAVCALLAQPLRRTLFQDERGAIRFHEGQSESIRLHNAIAAIIIENGYGYRTERVAQTTYVMQIAMQKGKTDVNLEARLNEWPQWYREQVKAGNILSLGTILEGSSQFFIIPAWVARQHNIQTVFDMRERWQLFRDPESPARGLFYNGPIGSGCERINALKLEAYGLSPHYNIISPPSAAALEAILKNHQQNKRPVFGFCWTPSALMGGSEWHVLGEPQHSEECWQEIMDALDRKPDRPISRACAYKTVAVEKLVHRSMLRKAPDAVEMLKKMALGHEALNAVLAWARSRSVQDWRRPAVHFLREYGDVWETWVTPAAVEKIRAALPSMAEPDAKAP